MGTDSLFMCDSEVEFCCRKNALQIAAVALRRVLDHLIRGIKISRQMQRFRLPLIHYNVSIFECAGLMYSKFKDSE